VGGGIRRVFPTGGAGGFLQVEGNHTGLDDGDAIFRMDAENAVHPGHGKHNAAVDRHTPADVSSPRAAHGHRYPVAMRIGHHRSHIRCALRKYHHVRQVADRPFVGGLTGEHPRVGGYLLRTDRLGQCIGDGGGTCHTGRWQRHGGFLNAWKGRRDGGGQSRHINFLVVLVGHAVGIKRRDDVVHGIEHDAIPGIGSIIVEWQHPLVEGLIDPVQVVVITGLMAEGRIGGRDDEGVDAIAGEFGEPTVVG